MNKLKIFSLVAASAFIAQFAVYANETSSSRAFTIQNRLRIEYDDNIYERNTDKTDSFKIIEEIELGLTLDNDPTYITLRLRPSFTYWDDREPDDTDVHWDFDVVINHKFSPRVSAGIKNVLRIAERPEEIDRGAVITENDDYTYNVTDGNVDVMVSPRTHAVIGGRYTILRYDRDAVSVSEDYDIYAVGLTLRHQATQNSYVTLDVRHEDVDYDLEARGSESLYAGAGIELTIGSSFVGTLRGGVQEKDFKSMDISDETSPYGDATLTYIHSPRTRVSVGAGYSMFEADVFPFASQDRTVVFASLAFDVTAKVSLYLSGSYQVSDYDQSQAIATGIMLPPAYQGEEEVSQGGARVAYRLNSQNTVEINYQHLDLSSDVREDFDRNRVSVGWRVNI